MASTFLFTEEVLASTGMPLANKGSTTAYTNPVWSTSDNEVLTLSSESVKHSGVTRLTKKFEGDDWKYLVESIPDLLHQTFICEASAALCVPASAIRDVELRLGSLYVTFHVTHDEDITQEELDQRIEEFPFREMWHLYNQRDGAVDGLDAALQKLKDIEEELAQKKRDLDALHAESGQQVRDLERKLDDTIKDLTEKAKEREADLMNELAKEQATRKKSDERFKTSEEQNKKLAENLKKEKARFEKTAQRHNDLIAAIIQENKKEKEAKEREYNEQLELKDYIIDNLKAQLREHMSESGIGRSTVDMDQSEEFSKLMTRMEEMAMVLQQTQESESEAHGEIQRLTEALKLSEEGRQAESVTYENNVLALKQQLNAYRDTKLTEDYENRVEENRARNGVSANKDTKENETIVRQYETALENIIGTLEDRLNILREEHKAYLAQSKEEIDTERAILEEHDEDSKEARQTFRTSSMALQKIYWSSREGGVSNIIQDLDNASSNVEKSSAAIKVAMAMLDSKKKGFNDQTEWMEAHQQSMNDLMNSLRALNKRAFERQLTLMNDAVANAAKE